MSRDENILAYSEAGAFLEKANGGDRGRIIDLSRERMSVGRTIDNDIVLPSDHVSRVHAYFFRNGSSWFIADNDSKNGILVNGVPVKEAPLVPGDLVQIGDQLFRFNHPQLAPRVETLRPVPRGMSYAVPMPSYSDPAGFSAAVAAYTATMPQERSRLPLYSALIAGLLAIAYFSAPVDLKPLASLDGPRTPERAPDVSQVVPPAEAPVAAKSSDPAKSEVVAKAERPEPPPPAEAKPKSAAPGAKALTASDVAKMDEKEELQVYLNEGRDFLKKGDFASAASAFQIAIVIDPQNELAMKGIRAAEYKLKDLDGVSLDSLPAAVKPKVTRAERRRQQKEKKKEVGELLEKARVALKSKSYSVAIGLAESARRVEVRGETAYLNEAKQIIDRARMAQKDDFEPFLKQAKEKFETGDYAGSRDLCEEMLRRDPGYTDAQECVTQAKQRLERTAKQ